MKRPRRGGGSVLIENGGGVSRGGGMGRGVGREGAGGGMSGLRCDTIAFCDPKVPTNYCQHREVKGLGANDSVRAPPPALTIAQRTY